MQGKKAIVLGAGLQGKALALDLLKGDTFSKVTATDIREEELKKLEKKSNGKIETKKMDITNREEAVEIIKEYDVAANSLPEKISDEGLMAATEAGTHLTEVTAYGPDKRVEMADDFEEAGIKVVPGCGYVPGITNALVGHAVSKLDNTKNVVVHAGGNLQNPKPPIYYKILFSLESVLTEYTTNPRAIKNHEIERVEAFGEREEIEFPEVFDEPLVSFAADELHTMSFTLKDDIENMITKAPRFKGHMKYFDTLIHAGMLSDEPTEMNGEEVKPREITRKQLEPKMKMEKDERDVSLTRLIIEGKQDGRDTKLTYQMIDYYDEENNITSMARCTAYPAAIAARMIVNDDIEGFGLKPVELELGKNEENFKKLMKELRKRDIRVNESVEKPL